MLSLLEELKLELELLKGGDKLKRFVPSYRPEPGYVFHRDRRLLDFTDWDCLNAGLSGRVRRAAQSEIESSGISSGASRLSSGTRDVHLLCEAALARLMNCPAAVLFSSRNQAVLSLITSLITERDMVIVEESMQSPVLDAAYLVGAETRTFNFESISLLAEDLERNTKKGRCFIFFEALSPISGKLADLKSMAFLVGRFGIVPVVDETYALGLIGARGAGSPELLPQSDWLRCHYAELSYGVGSYGAFVSGDAVLVSFLINKSRTFLSEPPLPQALAAATLTAIEVVESLPQERQKISFLASRLHNGLTALGMLCTGDSAVPFVCMKLKNVSAADEIGKFLMRKGFFVDTIRSSTLLSESAVIRMLINVKHTERNIDDLLDAYSEILPKLNGR